VPMFFSTIGVPAYDADIGLFFFDLLLSINVFGWPLSPHGSCNLSNRLGTLAASDEYLRSCPEDLLIFPSLKLLWHQARSSA
jgi:hypothetical protein